MLTPTQVDLSHRGFIRAFLPSKALSGSQHISKRAGKRFRKKQDTFIHCINPAAKRIGLVVFFFFSSQKFLNSEFPFRISVPVWILESARG